MSFFSYVRSKQWISRLLILILLVPILFLGNPKKTQALFGLDCMPFLCLDPAQDIEGGATTITTGVTAGASVTNAAFSAVQYTKNFILDGLANAVAKQIIRGITAQTVNWINTGFKGNPAYITNPDQFFLNVGDNVAAQFLSQSSVLSQLCSPFSAKVRLALVTRYLTDTNKNYTCTIDKVVQNYDNFTNDFSQGGWTGWLSMTQSSQNNPYGAYLTAQDSLRIDIGNQKTKFSEQIKTNQGFLSFQKCVKHGTVAGTGGSGIDESGEEYFEPSISNGKCIQTETVTPGSVIVSQLNNVVKSPVTQLELTNSINQIVSALMTQMFQQVVGGIGKGLHGLSQSGSSGGGSSGGSSQTFIQQMTTGSAQTKAEDTTIGASINQTKTDTYPPSSATSLSNLPTRNDIYNRNLGEQGTYVGGASGAADDFCTNYPTDPQCIKTTPPAQ